MKGDDIANRLIDFAVRIIKLVQSLSKTYAGRHISSQLVRAGTAAGANYEEARGAESRADFVHKLGIAWKETRESWYWLRLIQRAELVSPQLLASIVDEANQLSAILASSIATARKRS